MVEGKLEEMRGQAKDIFLSKNTLQERLQSLCAMAFYYGIPLPDFVNRFFISYNLQNTNEHTLRTEKFLSKYIVPESERCLVDAGAYAGMWALYVAKLGFEVHAFEPSPIPYATLLENAKKYSNLHTYQCALGDCRSTIKLSISKFYSQGIVQDGENTVTVPIRKLDDFQLAKVGVIKIDTEGYEVPILNGAKDTILKWKPRLTIEVHRRTGKALETYAEERNRIEKLLGNYGYSCKVHYRCLGRKEVQPFVIGTWGK